MKKSIILLSFIFLFSCKQETKKIQEKKTTDFNIEFNFPDTVYVGKYYNGKIFYKNIFDTATTKLLDIKKLRIIKYSFSVTKNLNNDIENLKKSITDTFIAENNRMIPLYNISFNNPGVRYIDGVITDEINIDGIMLRDGKMQASTRIITHEFRATHKVIVIKDRTKK
ncbi:hypothetical protein ACHRV6_05150 [Flavobacterium sp. FlaQc-51]|uniref:hypothetical protein n=1 Tax=Flavobacterium sp. FlaQc-51 TaxID=3374184 RepID=UPI0037567404